MTLATAIGSSIRRLRRNQNLQVKDLADNVPMSRPYLSEIENAHKIPSIELLADISKALNTTPADLWHEIYLNLKYHERRQETNA